MRPPPLAADTNSSSGVRPTVDASSSSSSANLSSSQLSERTSSSEASSVAAMPGEDTPLFPLMVTPMPKRMSSAGSLKSNRHGNSPPRGGSAGPTMFFLRSEDEMFPDSNTSETPSNIDEEEEEEEEEREEAEEEEEREEAEEEERDENEDEEESNSKEQMGSSKAQDSMFGVQSLASAFSTSDSEDAQVNHRQRISMPHVTPLSTAVAVAAMQHRNHFSSTPLSQPLTPIHLHSPTRGHSPIATGSTTDVIDVSGLGTPRSMSVGSFRQLSSDEEDERLSAEADVRSSAEVRGRLGLSPKREFSIEDNHNKLQQQQLLDRVSASLSEPQFIMPSVQIPPRRPFTTTGRYLGKLKVMVVGSKGVGKTSFIRSLVQSCMDIVHVDDPHSVMNASSSSTKLSAPTAIRRKSSSSNALHFPSASVAPTESIEEVHASTRARPSWWVDIENSNGNSMGGSSRNLKRRKSNVGGPPALQRNICFIDTPGNDFKNNELLNTLAPDVKIKEYIEALLWRNMQYPSLSSSSTSEMDLLHVLSGEGGLQVDLVLQLFSDTYTLEDIEFTKRLAQLTNICPVIAKSDQLGTEELSQLRQRLSRDLASIKVTHLLADGEEQHQQSETSTLPYAISSAPAKDENMDASLMMSPDYIPPLIPSDLSKMVSIIFDPDTTAWLRHMAAHRFIQWRRTIEPAMSSLPMTPSLASSSSYSGAFQHDRRDISFPLPSFGLAPNRQPSAAELESSIMMNSFENSGVFVSASRSRGLPPISLSTRLRMNEPLHDSEPPGQNNLARWAVDLQRSLRNERDRLEQARSEEHRVRIVKRIGNQEAEAGNNADDTRDNALLTWSNGTGAAEGGIDPLGLILVNDRLRQGGVLILKGVVAGVVLGKLIAWCAENLGFWEAINRVFPGEVGTAHVCS